MTSVWTDYTGEGVTVGVFDNGVEYTHADLDGNYDSSLHVVIGGAVHDPYPYAWDAGDHGTAVAGIIAAENDGQGTVGVAFDATIAGVDIFQLDEAAFVEAMWRQANFDVTNNSWGFSEAFGPRRFGHGDGLCDGQFPDPAGRERFQRDQCALHHWRRRDELG